jgi:hypothetical protein
MSITALLMGKAGSGTAHQSILLSGIVGLRVGARLPVQGTAALRRRTNGRSDHDWRAVRARRIHLQGTRHEPA